MLKDKGCQVNHKRVERIWIKEGLKDKIKNVTGLIVSVKELNKIDYIIAVMSSKGSVSKSLVASLIAVTLTPN